MRKVILMVALFAVPLTGFIEGAAPSMAVAESSALALSIGGEVTGLSGHPLPGVKVRIFREMAEVEEGMTWVDETSTDAKGRYAIELPGGTPLLLIFSGPQGYQAQVVRRSMEEGGGELSVTLSSFAETSSEQAKREQVMVIEELLAASRVAPAAEAKEMAAELRIMIDKVDPPVGMAKRISDISQSLTSTGDRLSSPLLHSSDSDQEPPKGPGTVWVISDEPPSL